MQSLRRRLSNQKQEVIECVNKYGIFHAMEEFGVNDLIAMKRFLTAPAWERHQITNHGYVFIFLPEHPQAHKSGYIKRARLVLEEKLGRLLLPNMEVHHRNTIRDDDRPENLEELTKSEHGVARTGQLYHKAIRRKSWRSGLRQLN